MKELLLSFATYNLWANQIILQKLETVSEEILQKDMQSSFGSIFETLIHMLDTESTWWQRIKLAEIIESPVASVGKDLNKLSAAWLKISREGAEWVKEANELRLVHVFGYHNSKKMYFKQPVSEALMHLFNHQTYHRGQIVTMLRQNKVDPIPATDLIKFYRSKRTKS